MRWRLALVDMLPAQLSILFACTWKEQAPPIRICNYFVEEMYHIKTDNSPFSYINYSLLCVTQHCVKKKNVAEC